jgi:hypothetical protein
MATSLDLRVPGTEGHAPPAVVGEYMDRLFALATRDPDVSLLVSRVLNLTSSPLSLCAPRTVWRALREHARPPLLGPIAIPGSLDAAALPGPPPSPAAPATLRAS